MYVADFASLKVRHLFTARRKSGLFERFYGNKAICFYLGRGALWRAVKVLHLKHTDKVLVPSYHCGVEIESLLRADVRLEYYIVNDDMTVDIGDLEERIDADARALFVIHYYGFPQDIGEIAKICRKHKLYLIEDCAHALFSKHRGRPLGLFSDIAIFSQRKSLPIPDGGAFLINNPDIKYDSNTQRPDRMAAWHSAMSFLLKDIKNKHKKSILFALLYNIKGWGGMFFEHNTKEHYSADMHFDTAMGKIGMSPLSKRIMDGIHHEAVISSRRSNYRYLLDRIKESDHIKICFKTLPDGTCPLFFPVRIKGRSRTEIQDYLSEKGIHTFVFGEYLHQSLPENDFTDAESLSREILCLPIHQDITRRKLNYMLSVINSL